MDIDKLRVYNEWIGKTPEEIIQAVKGVHGWTKVFPGALPLFAHQVRNLFNVEPLSLTRYPQDHADEMVAQIQEGFKNWGIVDTFKGVVGLSGDVYKDQMNRTWFQMSPGGAIYHWGGDPTWDVADSYRSQYWRGQDGIPIFKLVSPDGTGGSLETIIKNEPRRTTIGPANKLVPVGDKIVEVYRHQGSYNFSETVIAGNPAHERHDVSPHKKWPDYYLNYENRFSFAGRRFKAHRPDGKLIGYEKGWEPYEGIDTTRPDPPMPTGTGTITDAFGEAMAHPYSPGQKGYLERIERLKELFQRTGKPKRMLARIVAKSDKAAQDFYKILKKDTEHYLLQILRNRPQGGPKDV